MTITDILIPAISGAAVVASIWSGRAFYRDWQADIAFGEALEREEMEIAYDVQAYPNLKFTTEDLCARAEKARKSNKRSSHLAKAAENARVFQMLCEQRLRAAGYGYLILGEAA